MIFKQCVVLFHNESTFAKELNDELKKVNDWAFQWKMSFNPDPSKHAQEVIFSLKSKRPTNLPIVFKNNNVSQPFLKTTWVSC